MKVLILICLLITIGLIQGCSESETEESKSGNYYYPNVQNLIFFGTFEIVLEITPNVSQPSFAWNATGLKHVIITIFKSKIDLKDNQIANINDAIWTWNTGMGRGREGNISYSDGRDMRNGKILETVTPLTPGVYYIASWAYDDRYTLVGSSKEYKYEYK